MADDRRITARTLPGVRYIAVIVTAPCVTPDSSPDRVQDCHLKQRTDLLRLHTLGKAALTTESGEALAGLGAGKPLALLCYLAVHGSARREELVALLWGDSDEARARNAFRQALHRLRGALAGAIPQDGPSDTVRLIPDRLWIDFRAFEEALDRGAVDVALELYTGDFLPSLDVGSAEYSHWADGERRRLRGRYAAALEQATAAASLRGDLAAAESHATAWVASVPLDADAALQHAEILARAGRRADAIAALERFGERFSRETGAALPDRVPVLLRQLRAAQTTRSATTPVEQANVDEVQLGTLLGAWAGTVQDHGGLVIVEGGAEEERSALLNAFRERASSTARALVLAGSEIAHAGAPAYGAIAQALRGVIRAPGLGGASNHLLAEGARLLPELRDRFDLPDTGPIQDETGRLRFFEGVAAIIDAVAYEQPVCVVIEDGHRATTSTLDLLAYLTTRLRGAHVLFVVGLASDTILPAARRERLDQLYAHPALIDTVRLANARPVASTHLPIDARRAAAVRLQQRDATERRLVAVAALFTQAPSIKLLAASAHIAEPAAFDAVSELRQEQILVSDASGVRPASSALADAALDAAGPSGRELLAGWAADALAQAPNASAAELAHLSAAANRRAAAYLFARRAADAAAALAAIDEAIQHLEFARTYAATDGERRALEIQLASLGASELRLLKGSTPASATAPRRRPWLAAAVGLLAVLLIGIAVIRGGRSSAAPATLATQDTLVVVRGSSDERIGFVRTRRGFQEIRLEDAALPLWLERLSPPWLNPHPSPDGRTIAVERLTPTGSDVHLISADGRDTLALAATMGDELIADWSPDGQWLLVVHGAMDAAGSYDTDLYAYHVRAGERLPIDTTSDRAVAEALWSPNGTRIAWTARTGATHQLEVFVADADGRSVQNLSAHPGEDFDIAWSPHGDRIAFTSDRTGNADIHVHDLTTGQTSAVTNDAAHDDRAAFSLDGDAISFESTRGGSQGIYVVPADGGDPQIVAADAAQLKIDGWRGRRPPYVDRVRISLDDSPDALRASARLIDSRGNVLDAARLRWSASERLAVQGNAGDEIQLRSLSDGIAWVAASAGGWRADTTLVKIGATTLTLVNDTFDEIVTERWLALGVPQPAAAGSLSLNADRQWDSGVLGTATLPLDHQLLIAVTARGDFARASEAPASFTVALVAPEPADVIDPQAPQFLHLAAVRWIAEAERIAFSVGREIQTEPLPAAPLDSLVIGMRARADGRVDFLLNGAVRWTSSLRLDATYDPPRSRLWIGANGTGERIRVTRATVQLGDRMSAR